MLRKINARKYHLPKRIIKNHKVIINVKNFYDQPIDSDIKGYEEIRKLTAGQGEDYTTGCSLLDDYIKNRYRLIAVDLNWQKELDFDPITIQQIELVRQLMKWMIMMTAMINLKETRLKFSQGSVTVL